MEIRVDGSRSTNESWLEAHRIPIQSLPAMTPEEQRVAENLSISPEDYSRSKYAADLTKHQLEKRAYRVGQLVEDWLREHKLPAEVASVWLKTLDGKYRIDVRTGGDVELIFLKEELIDDILDAGSAEALRSFDRLLIANLLRHETARAS